MATTLPKGLLEVAYEEAAQAYLRSLPPEHFMEATAQATQRKITVQSMDLLKLQRPDVQTFNELLVQYPRPGQRRFGQVVPDNMVVVTKETIRADSSYNVPLEPAPPFCVMEYVSKHNKRKDYEESFNKYERELKVPFYLVFYPDNQELTLYRHNGRRYVSVKPNDEGRLAIPALDLEIGLLDGWVRYWHKGELLPITAELQQNLDEARRVAEAEKRRADDQQRRAEQLERLIEEEKALRGLDKQRADDLERRLARIETEFARFRAEAGKAPGE